MPRESTVFPNLPFRDLWNDGLLRTSRGGGRKSMITSFLRVRRGKAPTIAGAQAATAANLFRTDRSAALHRGGVLLDAVRRRARNFGGERDGNFSIIFGLLIIPIVLAGGMALDSTNINRIQADVQTALDAASMEIAVNLNSGLDDAGLEALGARFFNLTLASADPEAASFSFHGMTTDPDGTQSLSTSATYDYELLVPRSFGDNNSPSHLDFSFQSGIRSRNGDLACVYALNHTAPRAIDASGATAVVMDGCVLASNSNAADSVYVGGSADISADCIQSSGGIDATAGLTVDCDQIRLNAWRLPDPFAGIIEPAEPLLLANPAKSATTVAPARYSNLSLEGTKELQPGLYYVEGSLSIKGVITGTGVTIFMENGGITVNGSASISLSAPQEGPYAGILFMSSHSNTSAHLFNGNGATDLNGVLYFPSSEVTYLGNNATTTTCMRIVADTIVMSGSSNIRSDCTEELGGLEARVSGPLYYFQ